jgi:DNA repair exonuclease SbcCD ATPase subunit
MLEYLLIQNFQRHDKLRIDFAPDITTIVGPTDAGKSAIIRALRWTSTNWLPKGDFIYHDAEGVTAKGVTNKLGVDGHVITRRRSANGEINEYLLDEHLYKSFGRGVPEPIEQLLNLGPVCWQGQHDAPYWFDNTAGEVSRQLNAIVNLGVIDDALTNVGRAVHRGRTKCEMAEDDLTHAKQEYDSLAWVPKFEAAVTVVERAEACYNTAAYDAVTVGDLVGMVQSYRDAHQNATCAALAGQTAVQAGARSLKLGNRVKILQELVENAGKYTRAVWDIPPTRDMEDALNQYKKAKSRAEAVQDLVDDIRNKETQLCQLEKSYQIAKAAVPKVCPTCGASSQVTSTCKHGHR